MKLIYLSRVINLEQVEIAGQELARKSFGRTIKGEKHAKRGKSARQERRKFTEQRP